MKKLAPVSPKGGPVKLKRERKADIRPRKKPTPPVIKDIKDEAITRDIIDMPSGEMVATEPSRRSPVQFEQSAYLVKMRANQTAVNRAKR